MMVFRKVCTALKREPRGRTAPISGGHARSRSRDGVVLLVDGLLSGGHPEIRGGAHGRLQRPASDN
jgi:hypothetical protein